MKRFEVFFSSLFVIGLIGVLSLILFTNKPLENYFALSVILTIVILPKILLAFFNASKKLFKSLLKGIVEIIFFYFIFATIYSWHFHAYDKHGIFCAFILIIVYTWGLIYYLRDETTKKEFLKLILGNIKEQDKPENKEQFIFEGMFLLPGSKKDFIVKENFKVSQVKYEGVPRIGHIGPNFIKHFQDIVEPGQPKRSLNQYKPVEVSWFDKILSFVRAENHFVYLQDIWETMVLHEKGYCLSEDTKGILVTNGMLNVFPVRKPINEIWFIVVSMEMVNNICTWELEAYQKLNPLDKRGKIYSKN